MRAKEDIREEVRIERTQCSQKWLAARSAQVQERLLALPEFSEFKAVAMYLAYGAEVGTEAILADCKAVGRSVFVPAYDEDSGTYRLCRLDADVTLRPGRWDILEPVAPGWVSDAVEIDCMVVPGVAFDSAGGRVGHGCGYYDRMAVEPCVKGAWKVGLAFDFQVFDRVPAVAHDVPMDAVVTESRVLKREGE